MSSETQEHLSLVGRDPHILDAIAMGLQKAGYGLSRIATHLFGYTPINGQHDLLQSPAGDEILAIVTEKDGLERAVAMNPRVRTNFNAIRFVVDRIPGMAPISVGEYVRSKLSATPTHN